MFPEANSLVILFGPSITDQRPREVYCLQFLGVTDVES